MKLFFLLIIACIIYAAIYVFPMVNKEKMCFDATEAGYNTIQFNVVSKNLSKEDVCSQRSEMLLDLNDCLKSATSGSTLAPRINNIISNTVYLIRPLTKSLTTLKNEHNADCSDYEQYQLE